MTVNIFMSDTLNGNVLSDTTDIGSVTPSNSSTYQDIFIRHDAAVAPITDCGLYIYRFVHDNYPGINEDDDLEELIAFGDASSGGVNLVMDGWSGWTSGLNTSGTWNLIKTGYGTADSPAALPIDAIVVGTPNNPGEIPVDGVAHIQIKVDLPASIPRGAGYRAFDLVFTFSATS